MFNNVYDNLHCPINETDDFRKLFFFCYFHIICRQNDQCIKDCQVTQHVTKSILDQAIYHSLYNLWSLSVHMC